MTEESSVISHLDRTKVAYGVAWDLHNNTNDHHKHLWNRYRDMVKMYAAVFGALFISCGQVTELYISEHTSNFYFIAGFIGITLSTASMAVCGIRLWKVFEGNTYDAPSVTGARDALVNKAHDFHEIGKIPHKEEIDKDAVFPPLSDSQLIRGGHTLSAGLAESVEDITRMLFSSSISLVDTLKTRSTLMKRTRESMWASCVFVGITWTLSYIGQVLYS